MEYAPLDPYEQQLLKVFDSYDFEKRGSLDRDGLTQLCCTLQLEEQGLELVQHLINDPKSSRVTFNEFKEALLTLLGSVQNPSQDQTTDDKGSPDREVSPKFVYGSKKYGRRSRPRNEENILEELNENMNYTNAVTVQRSNSQSDVLHSKKRKTNTKLKRCTSFPGNHSYEKAGDVFVTNGFSNDEFVCTEEMLRKAWEKLGVGEDGYLNQTELILVCDAIGLHRLAKGVIRQLSSKLELDVNRRISFQELLEALQQDDTWSDVFDPSPTNPDPLSLSCMSDSIYPDTKMVHNVTLGPDGTGFINVDVIAEMWESVGISSPKVLLQELGFNDAQISVMELSATLEKEIKGLNETKTFTNPHIVLLQAILTLYKSEIRCLKNILEQMHAEREKLKNDVLEANNRATMLAQEVDDNHARMEQNTLNQVKLLEQRHSDIIKEVNQRFAGEKEQLSHLNQDLEQRIQYLEAEESKLHNDLLVAQEYSVSVEKENHSLNSQISELRQIKELLTEQVNILESEKQNYELENQQAQIEPLLKKLNALQIENSQLRDKNDEMLTEIESLNNHISAMKTKPINNSPFEHSMQEENISIVCEAVGLGSKRRNDDSPSKDLNVFGLGDGSPRLGKVRKCHKSKMDNLDVPTASCESGFDTELDAPDSSLSVSVNESEEIVQLQKKMSHLEEILKKHSIPLPAHFPLENDLANDMKIKQLARRCSDLQKVLVSVQNDINEMLQKDTCGCENAVLVKSLNQRLSKIREQNDACTETDNIEVQIEKYVKENQELVAKCSELENCIELLRTEYERCEDYWASKLDDERQMFEQEQNQSSEKLTELITKMAEYEAQFATQDEPDYRLPPIEEKYNLEKQFTDLDQEFEDYREQAEFQITEKIHEIADLKERLEMKQHKNVTDAGTQTCETKMNNLTNSLVESTNLFSADTMPFRWSNAQQNGEDYVDSTIWKNTKNEEAWQSSSPPLNQQPYSIISLPSTSAESMSTDATPTRPKRSRKHEKNYKVQRPNKKEDKGNQSSLFRPHNGEQMVSLPITVLHNLNGRLHHLEQRCRHLQLVLKQQHYHAEQMLQHCWQQHRGEKAELQYMLKNSQEKLEHQMRVCNEQLERLARTDMLVKDLYVENSYLVANVQRLEKQCHLLTQFNSASSSV